MASAYGATLAMSTQLPAVITKTVTIDTNGNVISQKIDSGNTNPTQGATPTMAQQFKTEPNKTKEITLLSAIFNNDIPTTTFPVMSSNQPNITLAQTLCSNGSNPALCPLNDLNSEFKSYGIYGRN